MKFALRYCNTGRYVDAKEAVALAQAAEAAGFESLWTVEHTIVPAGYASAYPYDPSGKMAGGRNDIPCPTADLDGIHRGGDQGHQARHGHPHPAAGQRA